MIASKSKQQSKNSTQETKGLKTEAHESKKEANNAKKDGQPTHPILRDILNAQNATGKFKHDVPYSVALAEIVKGQKTKHWIW